MFPKNRAAFVISLVLLFSIAFSFVTGFKVGSNQEIQGPTSISAVVKKKNTIEGTIKDRYGTVISEATQPGVGGEICHDEAYSYLVGINSTKYGTTGLRSRYFKYLYSHQKKSDRGATLNLTLDANLQEYTYKLLGNHVGSITVINCQTGEILAQASRGSETYGFNANRVLADDANAGINDDIMQQYNTIDAFFYNRATLAQDPPGSTFKVITAASLIENKMEKYTYNDTGRYTKGGNSIGNQNNAVYGKTDLKKALNYSINTYFASAGNELGNSRLQQTAENFGFNKVIELDYTTLSSNYSVRGETDVQGVAQNAFGQGTLMVSPMQMAMVIGAVMNDGTMMQPYLVSSITREDGKVLEQTKSNVLYKSIDKKTAAQLKKYLHSNAEHDLYRMGSDNGYYAIAKTGTAEVPGNKWHKYLVAGLETNAKNQYAICIDYANLTNPQVDLKGSMRTLLEYLSVADIAV